MEQWMFYIDLNKCIDCKTCEMACNDYHGLTGSHRRKVVSYQTANRTVHLSISCNHCNNPVCVVVCPENNFQKRRDGIVIHQSNNCQTCMRCINACPYQALKLNPKTNRADKCNFCVERIEDGKKPICVDNCVTTALSIIKIHQNQRSGHELRQLDIPIMTYTNPSVYVVEKQQKKTMTFFRKG